MVTLASSSITLNVGINVLTNFADNLDQDPPTVSFDSTEEGTLRWDFHTSATPPAAGAGDIATGTQAVIAGPNTADLDLSGFSGSTGYIHFRLIYGESTSNVFTSQQVTIPAFEPSALFANAEKGGFWDFTTAHCYTDVNRLTLATVGDTVGSVTDLSGRGNHLAQSDGTRRALLENDAGDRNRLNFDGVNDLLQTTTMALDDGDELSMMLVYDMPTPADRHLFRISDGNPFLSVRRSTGGQSIAEGNGGTSSGTSIRTISDPTARVQFSLMKINTSPSLRTRANGQDATANTTSLGSASNFGTDREISVGGRDAFGGWANVRIYAALIINRLLTTEEITDLETWAQTRSGITW